MDTTIIGDTGLVHFVSAVFENRSGTPAQKDIPQVAKV
jgi:hypothetical protein